MSDPFAQETAVLGLQIDQDITAFRAGRASGLLALDRPDLDVDIAATIAGRRQIRLRTKPDQVELAVLTALTDAYGPTLLYRRRGRPDDAHGSRGRLRAECADRRHLRISAQEMIYLSS